MAVYSEGNQLDWRKVEGGELPTPTCNLRATVVGNILYVTGGAGDGNSDSNNAFDDVLSWDPVEEKWTHVGKLTHKRNFHGGVAVAAAFVGC